MAGICLIGLLLLFIIQMPSSSPDQKNIPAESGQKNITLPCQAPNNNIRVLEWSRVDLGDEYVLLYWNGHFSLNDQHPSFVNRVDLQDRQMKDGDVSLILNNVTTADSGMYMCRVLMEETGSWEHSSIYLKVVPPGQPVGHTEDGGKEGGSVELKAGLAVAFFLFIVVVGAFVGCWIFRKHKPQSQDSHPPPAEPPIEMSESFLNSKSPAEYNDRNGLGANNFHQHSTRISDVTLTPENELLHPQETGGPLPEASECSR